MRDRLTKCKNCGRQSGDHQAGTHHCPGGRKHRTHGWAWFEKEQVFAPGLRGLYTTPEQTLAAKAATNELLNDYTDEEVLVLADQPTPKPAEGAWTLTAPDGSTWTADSPMRCVSAEMNDRVPPLVALARILRSLIEDRGA